MYSTSQLSAKIKQPKNASMLKERKTSQHFCGSNNIALSNLLRNINSDCLLPQQVFREVLWWFYLCSLERSCILPNAYRFCRLDPKDRYSTHAHCHRFDQSIVNVLLSNSWLTDGKSYTAKEDFFLIRRYVTHTYTVKVCKKTNT